MATFFEGYSHTFSEYLLVPGYSSTQNMPINVSLKTPLVRYRAGENSPIMLNIPLTSAIMQSVSGPRLAIALAQQGGLSFIYGSQTPEDEAAMVREVKSYKAGFVVSDSTLTPNMTLQDVVELLERTGHSTMPVTDDGTPTGRFLGIVTSRDYRLSRDDRGKKVIEFMTPADKCICGDENTSLSVANDIIWDHKLNTLPIVDRRGNLMSLVFRKDYDSHKGNPDELLDEHKRYLVGAGINTRDYAQRVPLLVEAGADVLCIDSSEGYSEWQRITLDWVREHYGESVKVGAVIVVDARLQQFNALFRHFLIVAAHAANLHGVGKGGSQIVKADDAEIIGLQVRGVLQRLKGVPRLDIAEYKQAVEARRLEPAQILRQLFLPVQRRAAVQYAGIRDDDGPVFG